MTADRAGSGTRSEAAEQAASVVVDAAIEVHRELGPGFSEVIYRSCMVQELRSRGVEVRPEVSVTVTYKGQSDHGNLRLDLLVDGELVVELKSVQELGRVHRKQLSAYLEVTGRELGLLLNFDVPLMKDGIQRVIR